MCANALDANVNASELLTDALLAVVRVLGLTQADTGEVVGREFRQWLVDLDG